MAVISCFFCQSLLSDFFEGLLPALRHDEIKKHLEACSPCRKAHQELSQSVKILNELPSQPLSHELVLQVTEASLAGRQPFLSKKRLSRIGISAAVLLVVSGGLVAAFPQVFPWFAWRTINDESHFVRYFPLFQGATEIVDEQASWFQVKEPFSRSLWEEGGLSPEEFEKSFQGKGTSPHPEIIEE